MLAASFADRKIDPLLAIARKNGLVEFLNPLNGDALATTKVDESDSLNGALKNDQFVGLHLFRTKKIELSSRLAVFLTCTEKGKACLRSVALRDAPADLHTDSPSSWNICTSGNVTCSSVDNTENYALFGGKGIEVNLWDLSKCSKIWTAKSPPSNSLGIFTPTWFTAATFLSKEDHRKIVAGTASHQVRLYDISAQRRPVISVSFRESPIKAVAEDIDGYTIYVGTGSGDLASFDMRTGKLLGCYVGKCCGSIRSIARHPELPVIASCGLDSYLRLWDARTRQLLSAVFLKQHLTNVVIDSHFSAEESEGNNVSRPSDLELLSQTEVEDEELQISKRSKTSKKQEKSKTKANKNRNKVQDDDPTSVLVSLSNVEPEDHGELPASKRRKSSEEESRRLKKKKSKKSL